MVSTTLSEYDVVYRDLFHLQAKMQANFQVWVLAG